MSRYRTHFSRVGSRDNHVVVRPSQHVLAINAQYQSYPLTSVRHAIPLIDVVIPVVGPLRKSCAALADLFALPICKHAIGLVHFFFQLDTTYFLLGDFRA